MKNDLTSVKFSTNLVLQGHADMDERYKHFCNLILAENHTKLCSVCGQRFANKFKRLRHEKEKHHEAHLMFACPHCDKQLNTRRSLQRHVNMVHGRPLTIPEDNLDYAVLKP